ncbi:MAG TPA: ABC transporter substrate-binding protein [Burkholderiales bacterium]|nr:ABC transporter substrate-binding protein [Burkholderiales bacterium]
MFLLSVGCAPLAVLAQNQKKLARIGFLSTFSRDAGAQRYGAFLAGMRDQGYVQGRDFLVEERYGDGDYGRISEFADELVRLKVDVIVAAPSPAIRAAQKATTRIPIVFPVTGDPVAGGFVQSLARPGGNITGLSNNSLESVGKALELVHEILPKAARVAVLADLGSSTQPQLLKSVEQAGKQIGLQVIAVPVRNKADIEPAFERLKSTNAEALLVTLAPVFSEERRRIAELAMRHRLIAVGQVPGYADAGGLMTLSQHPDASYRRAASYVDRILKGAKPADLPVEQTVLSLIINRKAADALGIVIPASILARAERIID